MSLVDGRNVWEKIVLSVLGSEPLTELAYENDLI